MSKRKKSPDSWSVRPPTSKERAADLLRWGWPFPEADRVWIEAVKRETEQTKHQMLGRLARDE